MSCDLPRRSRRTMISKIEAPQMLSEGRSRGKRSFFHDPWLPGPRDYTILFWRRSLDCRSSEIAFMITRAFEEPFFAKIMEGERCSAYLLYLLWSQYSQHCNFVDVNYAMLQRILSVLCSFFQLQHERTGRCTGRGSKPRQNIAWRKRNQVDELATYFDWKIQKEW